MKKKKRKLLNLKLSSTKRELFTAEISFINSKIKEIK
jgi:hypothetical protein